MHTFCTYTDENYLARLLCLYHSLKAQKEPFRLVALCLDSLTEQALKDLSYPEIERVALATLEAFDPEYRAAKNNRSPIEFYFTATPILIRYCLLKIPAADVVTYLDADLFFYSPASLVFRELVDASIGIVGHRYPQRLVYLRELGHYNVAWVSVWRDESGLSAVEWWRSCCLEWCFDRLENRKYGDQGYLNEFPERFEHVVEIHHPGVNVAPWNLESVHLESVDGQLRVEGRPLIFFHFQGVREVFPQWFDPGLRAYHAPFTQAARELVYTPYLRQLDRWQKQLFQKYGLRPALGYKRLTIGSSLAARWARFKARNVHPIFRRMIGALVHIDRSEPFDDQ